MTRPSQDDRVAYLRALCRTVPYTVVEPVLAEPSELSITPRSFDGVILHADLVGFTALCESLARSGADGLVRLTRALNDLFARLLEESLFPYEGYVLHFGGDSVTVLFQGQDAELRAAAAALHAQERMRTDLRTIAGDGDLLMRMGVARGRVHLPIVGDLTQRQAVCSGPAAYLAVELQERATPGTVLCDPEVIKVLGEVAEVRRPDADRVELIGLSRWPERHPIRELIGRVETDTEKKIALLEPFVPPPLAARLKSTPNGWRIEGELREVVILFAEISGLDQGNQIAPVTVDLSRSMLRAYRKYGGLVAKADLCRRGHRLMVIFGLHMPQGNDVERALLSALEATARVRGLAVASAASLEIRTGVHAGQVYYGAFGSDWRHDITVVGDAVNTAAQAASAAGPFEVLATDAAVEKAGAAFETRAKETIRVKGQSAPLGLRIVHGTREERARFMQVRRQQRYLAGRSAEASMLKQVVEQALSGTTKVVGIAGDAGTGKSALLSNLVDDWLRAGGTGLLGRCRYASRTEPLAPVVSMFSTALGLAGGDSDGARRERIREGFADSEASSELMVLMQPVRRPDGTTEALSDLADTHARERALAAVLAYLARRSDEKPVLYVLEDLHHADGLTLELAARASQLPKDRHMLFVGTYRLDPSVAAFRRATDLEVPVGPLAAGQCQDLVCHELSANAVDPALLDFLQRRTGGNPGHLVDVVRFLRERGLLPVRAGLATVPEGGAALLDDVVPQTAATVALARLDGLGEIERRLLRTASAFGSSFKRDVLQEVSRGEVGEERVVEAMESLEDQRLIAPDGLALGFTFRDEVTRAVAYGTMTEPRRREVHLRIAEALERRPGLDPKRDAPALALHWERAGKFASAARWYERAARAAFTAGLDEEVLGLCERWERCAAEPSGKRPDDAALRMGLIKLVALGRRRRQADTLRQARSLVARFAAQLDAGTKLLINFWLGAALVGLGQLDKAQVRLGRVFDAAQSERLRCEAALELARSMLVGWNGVAAAEWAAAAAKLAGGDPLLAARADLMSEEARAVKGELAPARESLATMVERCRRNGQLPLAARALAACARCDLHLRHFADAREGFEQALRLDRAMGSWADLASDLAGLGQGFLWDGRPQEARRPLEQALRCAQDQADSLVAAEASVHLGVCVALTSDPAEGLQLTLSGARLAAQVGAREAQLAADLHLLRIARIRSDAKAIAAMLGRCLDERRELRTPLLLGVLEELDPSGSPT